MLRNDWTIRLYGSELSLRLAPRGQPSRHAVQETTDQRRETDELVFFLSTQLDRPEVRQALAEIHRRLTTAQQTTTSVFQGAGRDFTNVWIMGTAAP